MNEFFVMGNPVMLRWKRWLDAASRKLPDLEIEPATRV
jgi:hypothetical protein